MEQQNSKKPCSTASKPSDDAVSGGYRFTSAENHHQTLMMTNSDQSIESAFSSLHLSSDDRLPYQVMPSRFHQCAAAASAAIAASHSSISPPMAFGESLQGSIWAQSQITGSSNNGPFGFRGAHQSIDVGSAVAGRGPYLHAGEGDHNHCNERLDFYDANCDNFGRYALHGNEPILINRRYNVPVVPFAWGNNSSSSWNSTYAEQELYNRRHHSTFKAMRRENVPPAKDQVLRVNSNLILEMLGESEIDMILLELKENWSDLLRNQFESQYVDRIFAVCNEYQRTRIIFDLVESPYNLVSICLNSFGARAIEKLLAKLNTPEQISLVVGSLTLGVLALATDPNGQNVINYCVEHFSGEYTKQLLNEIAQNCYRIATNKSGCFLLQSCVENSHGEAREQLINGIMANAVQLAEDPYGNYVVQHLIKLKMKEVTKRLLQRLQGCFLYLSFNKYGSNVVERMLESGEECCTTILLELLRSPNASLLLRDPFGNFVIQSALLASKGKAFDLLYNLIRVNAQSMESNLYGKKILAKLHKRQVVIA